MPRVTVPLGVAVVLTVVAPLSAIIQRLTSLREVLATENYVFTATVEKLDTSALSAEFVVTKDLKGKAPFRRLPVTLAGDAEAQKTNQAGQLLERLAPEMPLVVFASPHDKRTIAYAYSNGMWFQLVADVTEGQEAAPNFRFTHFEPYLRRTFKGTTDELHQ